MSIIKQTKSEVLINITSMSPSTKFWGVGFIIVSFMIPLLIVCFMLSAVGVTKLTCDRLEPQQVKCQFSQSRYLGLISVRDSTYKNVIATSIRKEEKVRTVKSEDSSIQETYFVYFLRLQTKTGEHDVYNVNDIDNIQPINDDLNKFLNSQQSSFSFINDGRFNISLYVFILVLFLISAIVFWTLSLIFFFLTFYSSEIILNKSRNTFTHKHGFLSQQWFDRVPLTDILKVEVQEFTDSEDKTKSFRAVILLRSQKKSPRSSNNQSKTGVLLWLQNLPLLQLKLQEKYSFPSTTHNPTAVKTANQLRQFLGFPLETESSK
jgi:ABC-type multidrug transport system fused ATPase/permease subunit